MANVISKEKTPSNSGYTSFYNITFPPMFPQQVGVSLPIPNSTTGDVNQLTFNKNMGSKVPLLKYIIKQQISGQ